MRVTIGGTDNLELFTIKLTACRSAKEAIWPVVVDSPRHERQRVERFARYFRREFGYDFVQFSACETDDDYVAFLFTERDVFGTPVPFGATCFRWRRWNDAPDGWAMQWIWMHPYYLAQGHLTEAWPLFRGLFGDFHVESPLSRAMEGFMVNAKQIEPCTDHLELMDIFGGAPYRRPERFVCRPELARASFAACGGAGSGGGGRRTASQTISRSILRRFRGPSNRSRREAGTQPLATRVISLAVVPNTADTYLTGWIGTWSGTW